MRVKAQIKKSHDKEDDWLQEKKQLKRARRSLLHGVLEHCIKEERDQARRIKDYAL